MFINYRVIVKFIKKLFLLRISRAIVPPRSPGSAIYCRRNIISVDIFVVLGTPNALLVRQVYSHERRTKPTS